MKLADLKIGTKLVSAFVIVAMIGGGIGLVGIVNMAKINDASALMYERELLAVSDVHSVGRYGGWTYCSIEDNLLETRALALKIVQP